jgi:hypothetical protein
VPRESFLTTGPPPTRAWKNPGPGAITLGARVAVTMQEGHRYDWRALTNPYWFHPPTGTTWAANAAVPDAILTHEDAQRWLVVDICPEPEWYEWKTHGDATPHPLQTVLRVPTEMVWVE